VRVHVEGVRLDECRLLRYLERGLLKASRDLLEAAERTPHTLSSRRLVEDSHALLLGLTRVVDVLEDRICGGRDTL